MEGCFILLVTFFGFCFSEWVLLPPILPEQYSMKTRLSDGYSYANTSSRKFTESCPDFHNLTAMTFGSVFKKKAQRRSDWQVSFEDVEDLLKENEKIPKTSGEMAHFVKQMGETLMTEAEHRVKSLFATFREARTKHFHFATMESALMTIAILLFGVYLSKLILKLLLSHYNRYNAGIMMTGIRAPIAFTHVKRERSAQLQEIQLMHLIDKYNSRFN